MVASEIASKEIRIHGSMCCQSHDYAMALDLTRRKVIDIHLLVACEIPLDAIKEAFETSLNGEGVKVLITP